MELFGHDHWSRAGHRPELLVDPDQVRFWLDLDEIDRLDVLPFHSFTTIAYDQALLLVFWLLSKLRLIGDEPTIVADRTRQVLRRLTQLAKIIRPILNEIDKPWTSRGLSNGILIMATKTIQQDQAAEALHPFSEPARVVA